MGFYMGAERDGLLFLCFFIWLHEVSEVCTGTHGPAKPGPVKLSRRTLHRHARAGKARPSEAVAAAHFPPVAPAEQMSDPL